MRIVSSFLGIAALWAVAACTPAPVDLLTVDGPGSSRTEEGAHFSIRGDGFPIARTGTATFVGSVGRGEERTRVEVTRDVRAVNATTAEFVVDEAFVEALHGDFEGELSLAFQGANAPLVARGKAEGVRFSVARRASDEMRRELARQRVAEERIAELGLEVAEGDGRVRVAAALADSPAEAAGFRPGDVVISAGEVVVRSLGDLGHPGVAEATSWILDREGARLRVAMRASRAHPSIARTDARALMVLGVAWCLLLLWATRMRDVARRAMDEALRVAQRRAAIAVARPRPALYEAIAVVVPLTTLAAAQRVVPLSPLMVAVAVAAVALSSQLSRRARPIVAARGAFAFVVCAVAVAAIAGSSTFGLAAESARAFRDQPWATASPAHLAAAIAMFVSACELTRDRAPYPTLLRAFAAMALAPLWRPYEGGPVVTLAVAGVLALALTFFAPRGPSSARTSALLVVVSVMSAAVALGFGVSEIVMRDLAWVTTLSAAAALTALALLIARRALAAAARHIRGASRAPEAVAP